MYAFIVENHTTLEQVALILFAFSLVFGAQFLGHFDKLLARGGFYSTLLVAIPDAFASTVLFYNWDIWSGGLYSRMLGEAFQHPLDSRTFAIGYGVLFGGLFTMLLPGRYRFNTKGAQQTISGGTLASSWLYILISSELGTIIAAQYIFVILGWFGGTRPPLFVVLFAGLVVPATLFMNGVLEAYNHDMLDIGGGVALILLLLTILLVLGCFALSAADIGFAVYLFRQVGWAAAVLTGAGVGVTLLLYAVRAGADRLSRKSLLWLFGMPGAAAALIQFALANPDALRMLPTFMR